ncbi:MAG: hypothetical protein M3O02_03175 [Acidobacteriota bacterium]|nr:hypothetical protein [Acidobacteriota bacterium]
MLEGLELLIGGGELGVQGGEDVDVGGLVAGQLAEVLALKGGDLGVLLVEFAFGVRELAVEEVGGLADGGGSVEEALLDEEAGDLAADALRGVGVAGAEGDDEAGQAVGLGDVGVDGFDDDGGAGGVDLLIHGHLLGGVEAVLVDDGLEAGAGEDLLLHGGDAAVEVLVDDGADVLGGNLLAIDEDQGLGDVLGIDGEGDGVGDEWREQGGDEQERPAAPEDGDVVFHIEGTMTEHDAPFVNGCRSGVPAARR